jgi:sporulation protein YlmC with PRC-barrel domain
MKIKIALAAVTVAALTCFAQAQQTTGVAPAEQAATLKSLPREASTVTNWYKQNVYDPQEQKIGEISDVLVGPDGKISAFMVSVGGFLGIGEKHVAVPFDAVHPAQRNGKWWLTMNATKDMLNSAVGYRYDRAKTAWEPA